jgi:hypothetical protein
LYGGDGSLNKNIKAISHSLWPYPEDVSNGFQYDMNFGSNDIGLKVKDILNKHYNILIH